MNREKSKPALVRFKILVLYRMKTLGNSYKTTQIPIVSTYWVVHAPERNSIYLLIPVLKALIHILALKLKMS